MKTRNELESAGTAPAAPVGTTARAVVAAAVLIVATVVVALLLTFGGDASPTKAPVAPAAPVAPVTTEYFGAPAD